MARVNIPSKPDLDLRGKKLLDVANGGPDDAVNKAYVDNLMASGGLPEYSTSVEYSAGDIVFSVSSGEISFYQYNSSTAASNVALTDSRWTRLLDTAYQVDLGIDPDDIREDSDGNISLNVNLVLEDNHAIDFEDSSNAVAASIGHSDTNSGLQIQSNATDENIFIIPNGTGKVYNNATANNDNELMDAGGLEIGATSVGHANHLDNNEEATIDLGYDGRVISELALNVETADATAAETFIKRNVSGEVVFSLSNTIQDGDSRPITSTVVNAAGYQDATQVGTAITNALVGVGGEISAAATYSQAGATISEVSSENRITFSTSAEVATFIENIGFPLGDQTHTILAGQSFNFEIINDDGDFSYSIGQATLPTDLSYDTGSSSYISFTTAAANFSVSRTGTIRTNLTEASVDKIIGGDNVSLTVSDGDLAINGDVSLEQLGGSNIWQESLRQQYSAGQQVSDFRIQTQGNVTTGLITHIDGANDYQLPGGATAVARASDETLDEYHDRFTINSEGGVDTLTVTNVVINSGTGITTISLSGTGATVDFTVTYPPANFGSNIGASTREYIRRATPAPTGTPTDAQELELRPRTADFSFSTALGVSVSDYWIQVLINGSAWRLHQDYIEGDEVEYVDSQGIPRHVFCKVPHTSSERTNPDLSSAVSHTGLPADFDIDTPWEPVGGSIDLSIGTSATPIQLMQDKATEGTFLPAVIFGLSESSDPNQPQTWSVIVGDGAGGTAQLEEENLPIVNDLISFGTGNTGTTEEYRVISVSGGTITTLTFSGRRPLDVRALFDLGVLVNIFDSGMRDDLGQIDRLVFDPADFIVNTEAQNVGHGHISTRGISGSTTFPVSPALGDEVFLDVSVSHTDGTNQRARGFYTYIQPGPDPASRFWQQLTPSNVGQLYNDARIGDVIYLQFAEDNFNGDDDADFTPGFYRATSNTLVSSVNQTTWTAISGGSTVTVTGSDDVVHTVDAPNFTDHAPTSLEAQYIYSPPFQVDTNDVSVQIDTREIADDIDLPTLRAQVRQIEEELSNPEDFIYSDDADTIYQTVFFTKRSNSTFSAATDVIVQPHFEDNGNTFTTYAVLTDAEFASWNEEQANDSIVGFGPNATSLVPFQIISSIYRQVSTDNNHLEVKLKMVGPDVTYAGEGALDDNPTNKRQFESWARPVGTDDNPNPIVHQGISTYYYLTTDDFLDTVRHSLGSHISGSSLTADERNAVDAFIGVSASTNNGKVIQINSTTTDSVTSYSYNAIDPGRTEAQVNAQIAENAIQASDFTINGTGNAVTNFDVNTSTNAITVTRGTITGGGAASTFNEATSITLDAPDAGGSAAENTWYWRTANPGGSPNNQPYAISAWSDLIEGGANPQNWRQAFFRKSADSASIITLQDFTGDGAENKTSTAITTVPANADLFGVRTFTTSTGSATFRVLTSGGPNDDTRFWLYELLEFTGTPSSTGALTISNSNYLTSTNGKVDGNIRFTGTVQAAEISTAGTASLTGGGTFGGTKTISGTTTFSGTKTISGTTTINGTVNGTAIPAVVAANTDVARVAAISTANNDAALNFRPLEGDGITITTLVDGRTEFAANTFLSSGTLAIPGTSREITMTGASEDISDFFTLAGNAANNVLATATLSDTTAPDVGEVSLRDTVPSPTQTWATVDEISARTGTDAAGLVNTLETGDRILIYFDNSNWCLFRARAAGSSNQVEVDEVESNGDPITGSGGTGTTPGATSMNVVISSDNVDVSSVLQFDDGSGVLSGSGIFSLVSSGLNVLQTETAPSSGVFIDTDVSTDLTLRANGGIDTTNMEATGSINNGSANAGAYWAMQLGSSIPTEITSGADGNFESTDPVNDSTTVTIADVVNGQAFAANTTYLAYTAPWKGENNFVLVDAINTLTGATVTTEETFDGLTVNQNYIT